MATAIERSVAHLSSSHCTMLFIEKQVYCTSSASNPKGKENTMFKALNKR